jgi:recombination protein RecA
LIISQPDNGEQALEIAEFNSFWSHWHCNWLGCSFDPKVKLREKWEIQNGSSRVWCLKLRKLTGTISKTHCTVFFINQLREKLGLCLEIQKQQLEEMHWNFASVRLDIRRSTQIKDGDNVLGNRTKVKVVKQSSSTI